MPRKYIIYAPEYSKSNGVRALYKMHDLLRARGYEAFIFCLGSHIGDYHYLSKISDAMKKNDIIIYPEVTSGNPLQFGRVARWVMYYPGENGGARRYHPSEMVFTWSKQYYEAPELWVPSIDPSLFFDAGLPKTQDCYFVHKGGKWKDLKEIEGLVEINMKFPSTRKQLAELLQTTGTLYSFDAHSVINDEAAICGAQVRIITHDGLADHECEGCNLTIFEHLLDFFIEQTQKNLLPSSIERIPFREKWKIRRKYIALTIYLRLQRIRKTVFIAKKIKDYSRFLKQYGVFLT